MAMKGRSLPPVITVEEVAEYLHVHKGTVYKLLHKGELPGFKIGTDWRFNSEQVDRWCREQAERRHHEIEK